MKVKTASLGPLLLCILMVSGCAASRTMVINPMTNVRHTVTNLEIAPIKATVDISQKDLEKIASRLAEKLKKTQQFDHVSSQPIFSNAVILQLTLMQYDKGSQFERWFWGGIGNTGEGSLTFRVIYLDKRTQEKLAEIQTEGRINSGFFGGDFDFAFNKALDEIVNYTVKHFKR